MARRCQGIVELSLTGGQRSPAGSGLPGVTSGARRVAPELDLLDGEGDEEAQQRNRDGVQEDAVQRARVALDRGFIDLGERALDLLQGLYLFDGETSMTRTTMNISLPDSLRRFIEYKVDTGGCGSVSDYIRELVRIDRRLEIQQLDAVAERAKARADAQRPMPVRPSLASAARRHPNDR